MNATRANSRSNDFISDLRFRDAEAKMSDKASETQEVDDVEDLVAAFTHTSVPSITLLFLQSPMLPQLSPRSNAPTLLSVLPQHPVS